MSYLRDQIENSNLKFHLCGSRLLQTHHPNSDWDYVVTDSKEVRTFLDQHGFKKMGPTKSTTNLQEMMTKLDRGVQYDTGETPTINVYYVSADGERIEVSVQTNAVYKLKVMKALKTSPELRRLDHSLRGTFERDTLWKALYALAGFEMKDKNTLY